MRCMTAVSNGPIAISLPKYLLRNIVPAMQIEFPPVGRYVPAASAGPTRVRGPARASGCADESGGMASRYPPDVPPLRRTVDPARPALRAGPSTASTVDHDEPTT